MSYSATLMLVDSLKEGDRVEVVHDVKVGFRKWTCTTRGTVVSKERRRHGLHYRRNFDDKVFSDTVLIQRDDGELTTITVDEFSEIRRVSS